MPQKMGQGGARGFLDFVSLTVSGMVLTVPQEQETVILPIPLGLLLWTGGAGGTESGLRLA